MKKSNPIQISVPKPCSEDWNKMTPQEQGRFCDSCQRCIIDFSNYSDEELYEYIASHKGQKICGRFKASQLNRNINLPPQPHSQLYKWIIAAGLALMISAVPNSPTFAQAPQTQEQVQISDSVNKEYYGRVSGVVNSHENEPVGNARIAVFNDNHSYRTKTDEDGTYLFENLPPGKYTIEAYIKATDSTLKRGVIKNVTIEAIERTFVNVTLSNGEDNFPNIQDVEPEITTHYLGFIAEPVKVKVEVEYEIERLPYRNTNEILQTVPGVYLNNR